MTDRRFTVMQLPAEDVPFRMGRADRLRPHAPFTEEASIISKLARHR
jgi:hypothetical protein